MTPLLERFLKFNLVSAIGIGVQLGTLAVLLLAAVAFGVSGHGPTRPTSSGALGGPPPSGS